MLLVTGGVGGLRFILSSTEVLPYGGGQPQAWRFAGELPSPRDGLRGVTLGHTLHVTGCNYFNRYCDEIVSWCALSETWSIAGHLTVARGYHGLTSAPLVVLQAMGYCPHYN